MNISGRILRNCHNKYEKKKIYIILCTLPNLLRENGKLKPYQFSNFQQTLVKQLETTKILIYRPTLKICFLDLPSEQINISAISQFIMLYQSCFKLDFPS